MNFIKRYNELLNGKFEKGEIQRCLRVNTLKTSEKDLIKRLKAKKIKLEKVKWLNFGYSYKSEFSLGATPEYLLGLYYLQENGSQKIVELLDLQEKDLVLDMCAAPGSKTTYISQLMNNKGQVIALDTNVRRIKSLANNIERMGCKNVAVYQKDSQFCDDLDLKFDKVLLDAPCSGNYALETGWFSKRDLEGVKSNARLQKKLLRAGIKVLKKSGILVYSTCSLEVEENENVIEWALENLSVKLVAIKGFGSEASSQNKEVRKCRRLWPHLDGSGYFMAKFVKM